MNAVRNLLVLLAALALTTANALPEREVAATDAALAWLALVDAGRYEDSYEACAPLFKRELTSGRWAELLTAVRKPLGRVEARRVASAVLTTELPDAPRGEYVIVVFETTFAGGKKGREFVTPMRALADGHKAPGGEPASWEVAGYYIRMAAEDVDADANADADEDSVPPSAQ